MLISMYNLSDGLTQYRYYKILTFSNLILIMLVKTFTSAAIYTVIDIKSTWMGPSKRKRKRNAIKWMIDVLIQYQLYR